MNVWALAWLWKTSIKMSKCCMFPSWRTAFDINLKLSNFFCYISSLTLLLQYVIFLSQKKPGHKEDNKEIRYSQCLFIHLKSLHDLQRGQITVCHFLYAINRWVDFLLLLLFCFVLSVVRNHCFVLSFVAVVIVPDSSAHILSCSRPYASLHSNQNGFYCLYSIMYIFAI